MKKALIRGVLIGVIFGFAFIVAQVATYSTLAQVPTASPGGALNLFSDFLGLAYNVDSAGTRQWVGPVFPMSKPPLTAWSNDHAGTFDTTYGYPYLAVPKLNAQALGFEYRTAPGAPYVCAALIYWDASGLPPGTATGSTTDTTSSVWVGFRDGTGKLITFGLDTIGSTQFGMEDDKWTNSTTYSANYKALNFTNFQPGGITALRNPVWLQWADDNTNLNFSWSIDGNHWRLFDSRLRADFFGSGPTQVGFGSQAQAADVALAVPSFVCK